MREEGRAQGVERPPRDDDGAQADAFVELVILQRVDDVEADQPKHDRDREQDREEAAVRERDRTIAQRKQIEAPAHREPRAQRREREREAEPDVRVVGEAFRERVKADEKQRDGREVEAKGIQEIRRRHESRTAESAKRDGADERDLARGQMAQRGARIHRIVFSIDDSVEGHRARARANHRRENQQKHAPTRPAARVARGDDHGGEREGQRENRVRELHEARPFDQRVEHQSRSSCQRATSVCGTPR